MYEAPKIETLGQLSQVTLGQHFSRVDGHSGTVGNRGQGQGGVS